MTKEKQQEVFNSFVEKMRETLLSKGDDYANEDRLSNFKMAGAIAGGDAETNCLNLIATKVARLGNLFKSKDIKNESVEDSILDLANYAVLLYMLRSEIPFYKVVYDPVSMGSHFPEIPPPPTYSL